MNRETPHRNSRRWVLSSMFGFAGIAGLALSFLHDAGGFVALHDPGPWMLPRILALALLVGGGILVIPDGQRAAGSGTEREAASKELRGRPRAAWKLMALVGGMAVYVAVLPWAGFLISTTLFVAALLWVLKVDWWRAILAAILLSAIGYGLFAVLFKVPLPAGAWN